MKRVPILITAAVLLLSGLASCTMRQDIELMKDGSGRVSVDIQLAGYLTDVIGQVQKVVNAQDAPNPDESLFDTEAITRDFSQREGVDLETIESPDNNNLTGSFRFDDINALYQEVDQTSAGARLIQLEDRGASKLLSVTITRDTYDALMEENPALNNPLVESFGPSANEGLGDEDYLSMMEWALGPESRRGILESSLDLRIQVEGTVVEQSGGTLLDNSTVLFRVPLLPVLLLNQPLEYSLEYK